MLVFIRSRICLLTLPISDLAGLIRQQVGLLAKFGLWSLRVVKALRLAVALMRSSNFCFLAMCGSRKYPYPPWMVNGSS